MTLLNYGQPEGAIIQMAYVFEDDPVHPSG